MKSLFASLRPAQDADHRTCAFCCGRQERSTALHVGLEPTVLERGPAHHPGCPLLRGRWPLVALAAMAMLPALPRACSASGDSLAPGLDTGTVGMAAPAPTAPEEA